MRQLGSRACYRAATFCSALGPPIDTLPLAFTVIDAAVRGTLLALLLLLAVLMLRAPATFARRSVGGGGGPFRPPPATH